MGLPESLLEPLQSLTTQYLLQGALLQFFAFTLVLVRLSGLMSTAPLFANLNVPMNVRVLLVIALSLVVAPSISGMDGEVFARLDANSDGWLEPTEVPEQLQARFAALQAWTGKPADAPLSAREFSLALQVPPSVLDYAWVAVGELALGVALGLGVMTILSCLQLAGQLIDQQTGLGLGEVFNPELDASVSISGDMLFNLGMLLFLTIGGHLLLVEVLLDTFRTLPLGQTFVALSTIELLTELVHQSLSLSLQVAAPLLGALSVVGLAMGFLGHSVPQVNVLIIGFPIRVLVGLVVFGAALSGMCDVVVDAVPATIEQIHGSLTGAADG